MLKRFHRARACQRRADEAQSYGFEFPRRELGCGIPGPEAVTVSRYDGEASDFRVPHQIVNLLPLGISCAVIVATAYPVSVRGPWILGHSGGEILQIHAVVESSERIAPDFPSRRRFAQMVLEPGLLVGAEDGPRRRLLARIRNAHIAEVEFGGRPPAVEGASRVERDH